jgi:hypothetical protein
MDHMHAVVRSMMSPDAGADPLDQYRPPTSDLFAVFVQFEIGPSEGPGAELFGLTVCSPQWLLQQQWPKGFEFLHSTLVIERWDVELIGQAVGSLCERTSGADWPAIAQSLSRFMAWEFADYHAS